MNNLSDKCCIDVGRRIDATGDLATMPHDGKPPEWFIDLWLAASDGDASDEDLDRFNKTIVEDAAARGQLLDLAQLQAWLEWLRIRPEET